ncbi:histone acetylase complex subunit [Colletotrichum truncatum]|uniref:Histone acetylase complex subunit n=1 Tax=Colletotrichum truncatum TaxID=5467 RepID=A0ACC3Z8B8_COLTU|nr:histone acetylase complex subunit [Colletotrichum truncatum]KAF6789161.1 histone acetylase complex subunit [Colletotrichum truncatum]
MSDASNWNSRDRVNFSTPQSTSGRIDRQHGLYEDVNENQHDSNLVQPDRIFQENYGNDAGPTDMPASCTTDHDQILGHNVLGYPSEMPSGAHYSAYNGYYWGYEESPLINPPFRQSSSDVDLVSVFEYWEPDEEEIESRCKSFLPQWRTINWEGNARDQTYTLVSPKAKPMAKCDRVPSFASKSSDSSVEFLWETPVNPRDSIYTDTSSTANVTRRQTPTNQETTHATQTDVADNCRYESYVNESNKRKRDSSVEILLCFRRNVRPKQHSV